MEDKEKNIVFKEIKNKILFEAISFISIIEVEEKENFDGSLSIYIKTNNLNTIELERLKNSVDVLKTEDIDIQIVVPIKKVLEGSMMIDNEDLICIYIN